MRNIGLLCAYKDLDSFKAGIITLRSCKINKSEIVRSYNDFYSLLAGVKRLENIMKSM